MTIHADELAGQSLSRRERQILMLLADGKNNAAISQELYIAPSTVKHFRSMIMAKLFAANTVQAVSVGYRLGLIPTDPELAEDVEIARMARQLGYRLALVPQENERLWTTI